MTIRVRLRVYYCRNGTGKVIQEATSYRSNPSREGFMESGQSVDDDKATLSQPAFQCVTAVATEI